MLDQIQWPALRFCGPRCWLRRIKSERDFRVMRFAGIESVKNLDYNYLVDSSGARFDIGVPRLTQPSSGLRQTWLRVTNPLVEVDFSELKFVRRMSLDELKEAV